MEKKNVLVRLASACLVCSLSAMMLSGCGPKENPIVTIEMENGGIIEIELYPKKAPNTVRNFISLINSGFYDGLTFHRVIEGFVAQGGCPEGTGYGGPGYYIRGEFTANNSANDLKHVDGAISMARANPYNSAGSQFFICLGAQPSLDGLYAVFGQVISGMDVVRQIQIGDVMAKVTVDTKGVVYPAPEKM